MDTGGLHFRVIQLELAVLNIKTALAVGEEFLGAMVVVDLVVVSDVVVSG